MNLQEAIEIINNHKDTTESVSKIERNLSDKIIDLFIPNHPEYYLVVGNWKAAYNKNDLCDFANRIIKKELVAVEATYYDDNGEVIKTEYQVIKNYGDGAIQYRAESMEAAKKFIKLKAFA